jgi:hypothetical protein
MKIIVSTQYRENYGAHSWNGEGECPQYWKNKGGDNLIVFTDEDYDLVTAARIINEITPLIEWFNDASENYVIDCRPMDDAEDTGIPDYEPEILIQKINGRWHCTKKYFGDAWYGNLAPAFGPAAPIVGGAGLLLNYLGKTEVYFMLPEGGRENYQCDYIKKSD